MAGRIISASHVTYGSSWVMAIVAHAAQAAGLAARMCKEHGLLPADIYRRGLVKVLQASLLKVGQYIPGVVLHDADDLV